MSRISSHVIVLMVALIVSGGFFTGGYLTWGQYPPAQENTFGFPNNAVPGDLVPQSPTSGAGVGPNFPQVAAAGNSELLMTTSLLSDGRQQVVITDTKAKTMAIYEVEPVTGKVLLRSVREIKWDLQMQQFNATSPTPGEIRSMSGTK